MDLIYIVEPQKYRKFMERGINKYLYKFIMPAYKPKKLHDIVIGDKTVGHVYGINLKALKLNEDEDLEEYILKIKEVIDDEYTSIYIEEDLPLEAIKTIENGLSLFQHDCKDMRLFNIPYIIDELISKIKRDIMKEEILIISNDKDEALKIFNSISNKLNFLSILGLNEIDAENVYEEVLDNIGVSIYFPDIKSISLKRYGLIINTMDNLSINLKDIRNNAFIIDFSSKKPLKAANRYVIEDISIDISDMGLVDNPWIEEEMDLNLYGSLFIEDNKIFSRVLSKDSLMTIENFVNQGFKIKGGF